MTNLKEGDVMSDKELLELFEEYKKEFGDDDITFEFFKIMSYELERETSNTKGKEEEENSVQGALKSLLNLEIGRESELYYTLETMGEDVVSLMKEVNENNLSYEEELEFLEKKIKDKNKEQNKKLTKVASKKLAKLSVIVLIVVMLFNITKVKDFANDVSDDISITLEKVGDGFAYFITGNKQDKEDSDEQVKMKRPTYIPEGYVIEREDINGNGYVVNYVNGENSVLIRCTLLEKSLAIDDNAREVYISEIYSIYKLQNSLLGVMYDNSFMYKIYCNNEKEKLKKILESFE